MENKSNFLEMPEEFQKVLEGEKATEKELPDDYPIYYGYFYVCDGRVIRNNIFLQGVVVDLKNEGAKVVTNCDIVARGLMNHIF